MTTPWLEGTVAGQICWTPRLLSLKVVVRNDAGQPSFEAGQFAKLALDVDGERIARPYSFVNPPGAGLLEFYYAVVPEGPLSPRLAALVEGDRVYLSASPTGFLVLSEVPDAQTLWLISTGTGIGPFLSILRTEAPWRRYEKVVLVHAARYPAEWVYADVVNGIAQARGAQFASVRIASREASGDALSGRIPALLQDGALESRVARALSAETSQVMLCGNPDMVRDVTAMLVARGMKKHRRRSPGQITVENYW